MALPPPSPDIHERLRALGLLATEADRSIVEILSKKASDNPQIEIEIPDIEKLIGERVSKSDVIQLLKELDKAKAGEFVTGRHGKNSRFKWSFCPTSTAAIFLHPKETIAGAQGSRIQCEEIASVSGVARKMHSHSFLLRPDLEVNLELPLDLTPEESQRLADFIRTLPF